MRITLGSIARLLVWAFIFGIGVWSGIEYGGATGRLLSTSVVAARNEVQAWFGGEESKAASKLSFPKSEYGGRDRGTPQNLALGGFEALYAAFERATGKRTNFQSILTLDQNSSIVRLSRGVGRLDLDADRAYACTAFLVSPEYVLTAAHCFYKGDVSCSGEATPRRNEPPFPDRLIEVTRASIVFNYHDISFGFGSDSPQVNVELQSFDRKRPTLRVPAELVCDHGVDYALIRLPKVEAAKLSAARISPLFLGDSLIRKRNQFFVLHYPDGKGLMATERHCVATDWPDKYPVVFGHYCDTLPGSSGAPVFSRDHAVVVALHVSSQAISAATEPQDFGFRE